MIIIIPAELHFNCSLTSPKCTARFIQRGQNLSVKLTHHFQLTQKLTPTPTPSSHVHPSNLLSPLLSSNTQFLDNMVFLVILKDSMLIWVYNSDQNMFWLSNSDVFPRFLFSGQQMVTYSRTRIPPQMQS